MRIQKADKLGLCFGVGRAIKLLKEAANKYGEIETLGPVAHNRLLVEQLNDLGVKPIDNLEQARSKILAITTHGTSPDVLSEIKARRTRIIDTTCPIVRKAQNAARELAEAGFDVIVFGDSEHSEVKGLLGWAGDKGAAALNTRQIGRMAKSSSRRRRRLDPPSSDSRDSLWDRWGLKSRKCGLSILYVKSCRNSRKLRRS